MINNLSVQSYDYFSKNGIKNNLNYYLKNTISAGKNNNEYDSSPHIKLMSILKWPQVSRLLKKMKILLII